MDALGEISQHARPLEILGPRLVGFPRRCVYRPLKPPPLINPKHSQFAQRGTAIVGLHRATDWTRYTSGYERGGALRVMHV